MNHEAPHGFVPVCASVLYETPGAIYVSIDPDVWKIRCRQCQEKTEHKCALKKLKKKFRVSTEYSRMKEKISEKDDDVEKSPKGDKGEGKGRKKEGEEGKEGKEEKERKEGKEGGKGKGKEKSPPKPDKDKNKVSAVKITGQALKKPRSPTASELALLPAVPIPTNYCACSDRPMDITALPYTCNCTIYRPLNFSLQLEVSGEFKPAYVPKEKKIKDSV